MGRRRGRRALLLAALGGIGFLGAGFLRVSLKNRPIAMKLAAKSGRITSKFDQDAGKTDTGIGHFE
jgi:hypothetical protein